MSAVSSMIGGSLECEDDVDEVDDELAVAVRYWA